MYMLYPWRIKWCLSGLPLWLLIHFSIVDLWLPFLTECSCISIYLYRAGWFQVIEKPMDFSKIKQLMEAKDGTAYKNVREICADVRLIFKNAMKYNDEKNDIHIMAKTLLAKFEEKWLLFLPKVVEEVKWCSISIWVDQFIEKHTLILWRNNVLGEKTRKGGSRGPAKYRTCSGGC